MNHVAALDLIDDYYVPATRKAQKDYPRGHIYWCPCCYLTERLSILYPRGSDPYHKEPTLFETRVIDPRNFNDPPHTPLTNPKLEADEELVVFHAKRRPVVMLSSKSEPWQYRAGKTRTRSVLVAPLYSFSEADSPEWKLRVRALAYRELFYLPENGELNLKESYVRLDLTHIVPGRWLKPKLACLHPDALQLLTDWFNFYVTGEMDEYLEEHREALLEAVDKVQAGGDP